MSLHWQGFKIFSTTACKHWCRKDHGPNVEIKKRNSAQQPLQPLLKLANVVLFYWPDGMSIDASTVLGACILQLGIECCSGKNDAQGASFLHHTEGALIRVCARSILSLWLGNFVVAAGCSGCSYHFCNLALLPRPSCTAGGYCLFHRPFCLPFDRPELLKRLPAGSSPCELLLLKPWRHPPLINRATTKQLDATRSQKIQWGFDWKRNSPIHQRTNRLVISTGQNRCRHEE